MLEGFLKEMAGIFPDNAVHLGHDEVNKNCYLDDPKFQAIFKTGKTLNQLLQTFHNKLQKITRQIQKTSIFWEEVILEFPILVQNTTIIQSWKGSESTRSIVERGYKVIVSDSKAWYLDCNLFLNLE